MSDHVKEVKEVSKGQTSNSPAGKSGTRSALFAALAIVLIVAIAVGLWYFLTLPNSDSKEPAPAGTTEITQDTDESAQEEAVEPVATESEQAPAPVIVSQADLTAYAAQVLQLVNEERRKAGVSPLLLQGNSNYVNAAQTRAREIATSYSNSRPNGSSFETVLSDNGIAYSAFTENIGKQVSTPAVLVQRFMSYQTTRNNILSAKFGKLAVGAYSNGSAGDIYWDLLFTD